MNEPTTHRDELAPLVARMLESGLTDAEHQRLSQMLRRSPRCVREYVEQVMMTDALQWELSSMSQQAQPLTLTEPSHRPRRAPHPPRFARAAMAAVVAVAASLLIALMAWQTTATPAPRVAGVVLNTDHALWADPDQAVRPMSPLLEGQVIELEAGQVRLGSLGGGGITLTGPCRLTVTAADRATLDYGSIAVHIPDNAQSITVQTPGLSVHDVGTTYGLVAEPDGRLAVHVLEGQVMVGPPDRTPGDADVQFTRVAASEARLFDRDGRIVRAITLDTARFANAPSAGELRWLAQWAHRLGDEPDAWNQALSQAVRDAETGLDQTLTARTNNPVVTYDFEYTADDKPLTGRALLQAAGDMQWNVTDAVSVRKLPAPLQFGVHHAGPAALTVEGRGESEKSLANRLAIRLPSVIREPTYISLLIRTRGLDDDDFAGFWLGRNPSFKDAHHRTVNFGIHENRYFIRTGLDNVNSFARQPERSAEPTHLMVVALEPPFGALGGRLSLWVDPEAADQTMPDAQMHVPADNWPTNMRWLGLRMGQHTEPTDRVWIDRLRISNDWPSVFKSTQPTAQEAP